MAAGALLITEAGGLVGDLEGNENYMEKGQIVAASPENLQPAAAAHPAACHRENEIGLMPLPCIAELRMTRPVPVRARKPRKYIMKLCLSIVLAFLCGVALAQETTIVRLRGEVAKLDAPKLVMKERSGKIIDMIVAGRSSVAEVIPTDITTIQPGSFIGTAAMSTSGRATAGPGSRRISRKPHAVSGEGHYPWDLKPDSTMTNATVADLARSPQGRTLTLRYKDGEKKVIVPDGVPVVTFRPGDRSLLVPGAKAFIVAEPQEDGTYIVKRLLVGRNGFQPPM